MAIVQSANRPTAQWTIYEAETGDALNFRAFMGADISADSKVISAPVERGSFVSYNKVNSPLEVSVQGAIKGEPDELATALDKLDELRQGVTLLNVVTPDRVYRDVNLVKLSYARTADDGADLIMFEAHFTEIKQITAMYTSTRVSTRISRGSKRGRQQAPEESLAHMAGRWIGG